MTMKHGWIAVLFVSLLAASNTAFATCQWNGTAPQSSYNVPRLPSTLDIAKADIGQVLVRRPLFISMNSISWLCSAGEPFSFKANVDGLVSNGAGIYATNVEGIGVRIGSSSDNSKPGFHADFEGRVGAPIIWPLNNYIWIEFIRTGTAVGSGAVTLSFTAEWKYGGLAPVTYRYSSSTTTLVNRIYFESCASAARSIDVPLGKATTSLIRQNAIPKKNFSFEVSCKSPEFTQKPAVKIYFEGKTQNGLLALTGAGDPGTATGVGIELTDDQGINKLPFAKNSAINLSWLRRDPDAEVYRFSGHARYVPSGGEVKAGAGDATLTYVLEYN
nr:fimbrial protein [Pseudoxanthomonas sp.]